MGYVWGSKVVPCAMLVALIALLTAAGCQKKQAPQNLLPALRAQVEADDNAYNANMNSYGRPKMTPDGSAFTVARTMRAVAVPWDQIKIEETGKNVAAYRALVPKTLTTFVKSGASAETCAAAEERQLEPQRTDVTYEYDAFQKAWHVEQSLLH